MLCYDGLHHFVPVGSIPGDAVKCNLDPEDKWRPLVGQNLTPVASCNLSDEKIVINFYKAPTYETISMTVHGGLGTPPITLPMDVDRPPEEIFVTTRSLIIRDKNHNAYSLVRGLSAEKQMLDSVALKQLQTDTPPSQACAAMNNCEEKNEPAETPK